MMDRFPLAWMLLLLSTCSGSTSNHQEAIENLVQRPHYAPPSSQRRLKEQPFCNDDGSVDFSQEDSFNRYALKRDFSPMCECVDRDNSEKVLGFLDQWLSNGAPMSVIGDRANDVIGTITGEQSYECINGCEFCFASQEEVAPKKCGIYESTYKYTYQVADSSAVLEELKAGNSEKVLVGGGHYMHSDFFFDFCFRHTVGAEGRTCFGTNPRGMKEVHEALNECFVSHDTKLCSSCTMVNATSCFQANCTNIEGGGMIDSCDKETMTGPFEILHHYQDQTDSLTRGACGDIEKVGNHPTTAPLDEGGAGYTDTLVRVERVASSGSVTSVLAAIGISVMSMVGVQ